MCEELSNEELAIRSQNGDSASLELLATRFSAKRVAKFPAGYLDTDDLNQEGMLGLLSAVSSFKQGCGASFDTYATACIRNRIVSAARKATQYKGETSSCEEYTGLASDSPNPLDSVIDDERINSLLSLLRTKLSDEERAATALYIEGYTVRDIAAKLCVSEKSAENALQRSKRKLKLLYSVTE